MMNSAIIHFYPRTARIKRILDLQNFDKPVYKPQYCLVEKFGRLNIVEESIREAVVQFTHIFSYTESFLLLGSFQRPWVWAMYH